MSALTYEEKKRQLTDFMRSQRGANIRLGKATSNLFRDRRETAAQRKTANMSTARLARGRVR